MASDADIVEKDHLWMGTTWEIPNNTATFASIKNGTHGNLEFTNQQY